MKTVPIIQEAAVALAIIGLFVPSMAIGAAPTTSPQPVADIALDSGGLLQGRLVDPNGVAMAAQSVSVVYDGKVVAKADTDLNGNFQVSGLRGGAHVIATTGTSSMCRLWAGNAAPPQAHTSVLIVEPQVTARAQGGPKGHGKRGGIRRFVNARTLLITAAVGGIIWAATDDDNRRSASAE